MPSLTVTYTARSSEAELTGSVQLEQQPLPESAGRLTKAGFFAYLDNLIYGDNEEPSGNCLMEGDELPLVIYAYPSPSTLAYTIGVTRGILGKRQVALQVFSELVQVSGSAEIDLRYPAKKIIEAGWLVDPSHPETTANLPAIIIDGGEISLAAAATGSLLVVYQVLQHTYPLTITAREESIEAQYQAHCYAVWSGGNNVIELDPGDEAAAGGQCNSTFSGNFSGSEPGEPYAPPEDVDKYWLYCGNCEAQHSYGIYNGIGTHTWSCKQ